jgi:flagella basal body P-ring formation protein FlgA
MPKYKFAWDYLSFTPLFLLFILTNIDSVSAEQAYMRPRVILKTDNSKPTERVKLSSILVLPKSLPDTTIEIPFTGSSLTLDAESLIPLLPPQYSGLKILGGKTEILLLNQKFSTEDLEDSLSSEILKRNPNESEFRVTYLGGEVSLPSGLEKKWGNFPKEMSPGTKIFTLDTWKENKRIYSARLKFKIEKKITIAIIARRVERFHQLEAGDYEMKSLFTDEPARDLVTEEPAGLAALIALEPGMTLRKKHIRLVHAIERGSEIETIYQSGNITIKARAIAKRSGNPGDVIEARSLPGNVPLKGRVKTRGVMEIE